MIDHTFHTAGSDRSSAPAQMPAADRPARDRTSSSTGLPERQAEGRMRVILLEWAVLLVLLVLLLLGGGALSGAAAKAKRDAKPERAARDSVLMIPRLSRAPTIERVLEERATSG